MIFVLGITYAYLIMLAQFMIYQSTLPCFIPGSHFESNRPFCLSNYDGNIREWFIIEICVFYTNLIVSLIYLIKYR